MKKHLYAVWYTIECEDNDVFKEKTNMLEADSKEELAQILETMHEDYTVSIERIDTKV